MNFNEGMFNLINDIILDIDELLDYDRDEEYFNNSSLHKPTKNFDTVLMCKAIMKKLLDEMKGIMKTDYKFKAGDVIEYKGSIYFVEQKPMFGSNGYFLKKLTGLDRTKEFINEGVINNLATKVTDPCALLLVELLLSLRSGFRG